MIIVRLQGGLGNQLFQYAAGKALAADLNKPFKLETITSLKKDKQRNIALHDLEAKFEMADEQQVKEFVRFPSLYRHPLKIFKAGKHIYREPHFHFDENFFRLNDPVFLDGFWQSPRYFKKIESAIRQDFTIKPELIKDVIEKGNELQNKPSVAIHIRRGDFLRPKIKAYHGVMSAFYFEKAIGIMKEKINNPYICFFTDDIEWVKQNISFNKNTELISASTKSAIEDFYLMSKCRHNVIANSSFSWWPAWLNTNPDKIVIAPEKWFAVNTINTSDLIPANWIRI